MKFLYLEFRKENFFKVKCLQVLPLNLKKALKKTFLVKIYGYLNKILTLILKIVLKYA